MASISLSQKIVFSCAIFFYVFGLILAIVGIRGNWLEPKEFDNGILSVGLLTACFDNFRFEHQYDSVQQKFDGCKDVTRNSAIFKNLVDYVQPPWFLRIQDMHLASLILLVFVFLFIGGFIAVYYLVYRREQTRKKPSPTMVLAKATLALWFIITAIAGIMLICEAIIFYHNYEDSPNQFFPSRSPFQYGAGFGCTIGGGVSLLLSTGAGVYMFVVMVRDLLKKVLSNQQNNEEEFDNPQEKESLNNRQSSDQAVPVRTDPDGDIADMQRYQKEPSRGSVHESALSPDTLDIKPQRDSRLSVEQMDTRSASGSYSPDGKPIPAPRMSRESSREPSIRAEEVTPIRENPSQYQQQSRGRSPGRSPNRGVNYDPAFMMDKSARSVSDTESLRTGSYASQQPYTPPQGMYNPHRGGPYTAGPHRYPSSITGSETESQRGERNRSVSRSAFGAEYERRMELQHQQEQQKNIEKNIIKPTASSDRKHSRYTMY